MPRYPLAIGKDCTLPDIELMIQGEEAGAATFVDSVMRTHEGVLSNLATFETLPAGMPVSPLTLVENGKPGPAGKQRIWSGTMLVCGAATAVVAYR